MRMRLQVLAEQIFPVIIAIGRAHYRVHVLACRQFRAVQGDGALVIELNHRHRAEYRGRALLFIKGID